MSKATQEQVLSVVIEVLKGSSSMLDAYTDAILMETDLVEDLGLDSLRLVSILSNLEDHYDIEFSVEDTDARLFFKVADIVGVTLRTLNAEEA